MVRTAFLGFITFCIASNTLWAQQGPSGGKEGVSRGFESNSPEIGQMLPDLAGFDADGKEFRLRSLKGHYSVLVFGCLT